MPELVFFSDLKAIAENAVKLKQKEIIIVQRFKGKAELLELRRKVEKENFKAKFCYLLEKPEEKLDGELEHAVDYFGCFGGTVAANKGIVSAKRIDFLFQPVAAQRLEFDSALANSARDNNVAIAILFRDFLNASQRDLVSLLRNHFLLAKICRRAGAQLVVFSGAHLPKEMRSESDLQSFLALLHQNNLSIDDLEEGE